ncbi:MAG: FecR domain-containing protein [Anaerolineales bacterium]|nr:FecR domain-containing protein [Anaerolineales bacterium]
MNYKIFLPLVIFCLAACAPVSSTAIPPTVVARAASLSEVTGLAQTLTAPGMQWLEAGVGQKIAAGGGVQTGIDGRIRLDISDGTIMRLAPENQFTLDVFSPSAENPSTLFLLEAGHVFIQVTKELGTGNFELKTPSGVAAVRGSLMAVEFHPANGHMIATCLEGACRLTANTGNFTDLVGGQQAGIRTFNAEQPTNPITIDSQRLNEWLQEFPEAANIANTITPGPPPTPTQVP